jgi:glycosyltransferase involved in cell wall biosynthesis
MANSGWSWQLFCAPVLWIGFMRRTPVIVNYRGGEAREYLAASARWVKPSMARAAALVVPSGFLQQVFSEFGIASTVIPNIIDLDTFSPAQLQTQGQNFNLVVTRNLEPIYGLETAIQALALARAQIPAIQLKIAGSGPQGPQLRELVTRLGQDGAVEFLGRLERDAVVALYHSADAMLNPSRVDNMPNSVLEALACGLPVISTRVGGVPYIVEEGETALLVAPDNPQEMARAILRLYKDATLRNHLRECGCREVAQYAWKEVRPQWLSLYNTVGMAA